MAANDASPVKYDGGGEDEIRLEHKKPFSAGLRRKLIQFVPASTEEISTTEQNRATSTPANSIQDMYLNIVMPPRDTASAPPDNPVSRRICEHIKSAWSTLIPHRLSIGHAWAWPSSSHRVGIQMQGGGLGASQQGVQYPIKAKPKEDTLGIGVQVPKDLEKWKKEKPQKLDAAKVRKKVAEDKKRREKLQQQFYGNPDIEKYLG
ncbi:g-patch domain-containing protein [Apiospora arundinis]